jgi:exoribonuclease R
LVEDFMLLANEIVARISEDAGFPVLYRVHEAPPRDKLLKLQGFLASRPRRVLLAPRNSKSYSRRWRAPRRVGWYRRWSYAR